MKNNEQTIKAIVSELKDELRVTDLAKNDRVQETIDKLEQKIEIHEKTKRVLANLGLLLLIIFAVLMAVNFLLLDRNDA